MANLPDEVVTQAQYIERWERALVVLEGMSEHERTKHFDMDSWGRKTPCGTVACVAGHCSLSPWFIERGFHSKLLHGVWLDFTGFSTRQFFGEGGHADVFMATREKYDTIVGLVRDHIAYLKRGGDPNTPQIDRPESYYDEEEVSDEY
jgi:hypothetical protein